MKRPEGVVLQKPQRGREKELRKVVEKVKSGKWQFSRGQNLENCQLRGHGSKDIFTGQWKQKSDGSKLRNESKVKEKGR